MDKIVIQFDIDGGYECGSFLAVECLEYESVEALYVHFEEKVQQYVEALQRYREAWKRWEPTSGRLALEINKVNNQKPSTKRDKHLAELQTEYAENEKIHPDYPLPEQKFSFNGVEFDADNFIIRSDKEREYSIDMPIMMKLNEWFTAKREGKI